MTQAGSELEWRRWDDVFIVYQPTSAETHVFNEATANILECLKQGAKSMDAITDSLAIALAIEPIELSRGDWMFALERLEFLGLIERTEEAVPGR